MEKLLDVLLKASVLIVVASCAASPAALLQQAPAAVVSLDGTPNAIANCAQYDLVTQNPGANISSQGLGEDVRTLRKSGYVLVEGRAKNGYMLYAVRLETMEQGVEELSTHRISFPGRRGVLLTRSEEHTSELQSLMSISYAV